MDTDLAPTQTHPASPGPTPDVRQPWTAGGRAKQMLDPDRLVCQAGILDLRGAADRAEVAVLRSLLATDDADQFSRAGPSTLVLGGFRQRRDRAMDVARQDRRIPCRRPP